jgi:hypothetical protein
MKLGMINIETTEGSDSRAFLIIVKKKKVSGQVEKV